MGTYLNANPQLPVRGLLDALFTSRWEGMLTTMDGMNRREERVSGLQRERLL